MDGYKNQFELDMESLEKVNGGGEEGYNKEEAYSRANAVLERAIGKLRINTALEQKYIKLNPYVDIEGNVYKFFANGKEVTCEEFISLIETEFGL